MSQRADALPPGYRLHVYGIDAVLGAGGFGITYRGTEAHTERKVAIKEFLPAGLALRAGDRIGVEPISSGSREDFAWGLDRFRQEARTLLAFRHPAIVSVLQYFEANGTGYLAMEYHEGATLGTLIRPDRRLAPDEIDEILPALLDGLEAVHAKGFLHRDIKPDNIFVRADGPPVLIDFGAARQAIGARSLTLTQIVSEGYAPFEQYQTDGAQGPWTDLYALGATLYRCMTGRRPVDAPARVAAQMRGQPDPMPALAPLARDYAPALVRAVEAAFAVMEAHRPQSVAAFRALMAPATANRYAAPPPGTIALGEAPAPMTQYAPRRPAAEKAEPLPPPIPAAPRNAKAPSRRPGPQPAPQHRAPPSPAQRPARERPLPGDDLALGRRRFVLAAAVLLGGGATIALGLSAVPRNTPAEAILVFAGGWATLIGVPFLLVILRHMFAYYWLTVGATIVLGFAVWFIALAIVEAPRPDERSSVYGIIAGVLVSGLSAIPLWTGPVRRHLRRRSDARTVEPARR